MTLHLFARARQEGDAMDYSALTDEELFALWRAQGDHAAFAEIERRHSDALLGFAHRRLARMGVEAPDHTAEDCVTETFLRLSIQPGPLPSVRSWLYRVLGNLVNDEGRRRGRRPTQSLDASKEDGPSALGPADPGPGPLEMILDEPHRLGAILECVEALPEHLREVVVMHYLEGLSYEEIEERTGLSQGQIASRLHKARQLLADCYTRRLSGAE